MMCPLVRMDIVQKQAVKSYSYVIHKILQTVDNYYLQLTLFLSF